MTEQVVDGALDCSCPTRTARVAGRRELLLADPAPRRRLGAGLGQTVQARYCTSELARAWEQLFEEVLTEGPR